MNRIFTILLFLLPVFSGCLNTPSSRLINGVQAPDIAQPDKDGNMRTLSSLRGNIVFLDFWASWCQPCRKQNPKIVAIYDKYKDASFGEGKFIIYSVSLDSDREKWLKAIEQDKLEWEHHVSELKGWQSAASDSFEITSIPASFLLDQNGVIIGKDLRYQDLDKILSLRVSQ